MRTGTPGQFPGAVERGKGVEGEGERWKRAREKKENKVAFSLPVCASTPGKEGRRAASAIRLLGVPCVCLWRVRRKGHIQRRARSSLPSCKLKRSQRVAGVWFVAFRVATLSSVTFWFVTHFAIEPAKDVTRGLCHFGKKHCSNAWVITMCYHVLPSFIEAL